MKDKLKEMQKEVNALYEKEGLTDTVLEKQVEINTLRHEHDIPDTHELVFMEFSQ